MAKQQQKPATFDEFILQHFDDLTPEEKLWIFKNPEKVTSQGIVTFINKARDRMPSKFNIQGNPIVIPAQEESIIDYKLLGNNAPQESFLGKISLHDRFRAGALYDHYPKTSEAILYPHGLQKNVSWSGLLESIELVLGNLAELKNHTLTPHQALYLMNNLREEEEYIGLIEGFEEQFPHERGRGPNYPDFKAIHFIRFYFGKAANQKPGRFIDWNFLGGVYPLEEDMRASGTWYDRNYDTDTRILFKKRFE